jgi:hypothetical protein
LLPGHACLAHLLLLLLQTQAHCTRLLLLLLLPPGQRFLQGMLQ